MHMVRCVNIVLHKTLYQMHL